MSRSVRPDVLRWCAVLLRTQPNRHANTKQSCAHGRSPYHPAGLCLCLSPWPSRSHQSICDLPTAAPPPPPLPQVREQLGLPLNVRLAVLIHGGHKAELDVREDFLPPGWVCVACNGGRPLGPHPLPPNFMLAPADVYTPDLVEASDCILGKIGYG